MTLPLCFFINKWSKLKLINEVKQNYYFDLFYSINKNACLSNSNALLVQVSSFYRTFIYINDARKWLFKFMKLRCFFESTDENYLILIVSVHSSETL